MTPVRTFAAALLAALSCSSAALAQGFLVEDSSSTLDYGTATGQTAQPTSRMQVFGFPVHGRTVELQLRDARPAAAAWFYLSYAPDNAVVPGLGTVLVDLSAPTIVGGMTDAAGHASIQMSIPFGVPAGTTVYVQCLTADIGSPTPLLELSSASELIVGEVARPISSTSNLDGDLALQNGTPLATMSGLYGVNSASIGGGNTVDGTLSVHVKAADFTFNGAAVEDFMVSPGLDEGALVWDASNCYTASAFDTEFAVTYRVGSTEYGPFEINGTLTASPTDVTLDLEPISSPSAGPLVGIDLTLALRAHNVGAGYFEVKEGLLLPADGSEGSLVTPEDADLAFSTMSALMASAIAAAQGDITYYDASMPSYPEFQELEGLILAEYTDGMATSVAEVQALIQANVISFEDGWLSMIASKILAAAGIHDGWKAFKDVLSSQCGDKLKEIGKHMDAKEYAKALDKVIEVLDTIFSKKFGKELAEKAGSKMAGEILEKLGARCIPFVGWCYFGACLVWAFVEQWL